MADIPTFPRGLRIAEAACYLGATVSFVRIAIASGELPAARFGKRLILDRKDLDALLERSRVVAKRTEKLAA